MNTEERSVMQAALDALTKIERIVLLDPPHRATVFEVATVCGLVGNKLRAALAQPDEADDLTIAYMAGYSKGKDAQPEQPAPEIERLRVVNADLLAFAEMIAAADFTASASHRAAARAVIASQVDG
jgi:O-acetyl-ADP-ribose deacetylase (regulator of RNase III)